VTRFLSKSFSLTLWKLEFYDIRVDVFSPVYLEELAIDSVGVLIDVMPTL
jgi:hypothetical protein